LVLRIAAIALGAIVLFVHPSSAWIERDYANGFYPWWERVVTAITGIFPFSLGDVAVALGLGLIAWRLVVRAGKGRRAHPMRAAGFALFDAAVILALYAVWFQCGWGWNYDRPPVESRLQYDAARVTPPAMTALRDRAIAEMNALAPAARARAADPIDLSALRADWLPAVQRAGDDWSPRTPGPKLTLAAPFMDLNGTAGFINPLALTVQMAPDLLWFERPFDLAHEWSHLAGYAREDEANYLATIACLRSQDPVVRYSGWLELFLALPRLSRYPRSTFSPLVWSDFAAMRARDASHINLAFARWSWRTYNAYLKSNRIASGIANYDEVTRLMLAIPLDGQGLPLARSMTP
jgi:hypothetical protein